jgi:HPt (histidine-containing phosphotransfer) domain-containing protein
MNDYLAKPMTLDRLADVLQRWLPGRIIAPTSAGPRAALQVADRVGEPVLDASVLSQLADSERGGDPAFVVELIDLFVTQARPLLADLRWAGEAGDRQGIARIAHTLQSSAGNLGARRLQRLCAEAESTAKTSGDAWAKDTAHTLTAEIESVIGALEQERRRTAA